MSSVQPQSWREERKLTTGPRFDPRLAAPFVEKSLSENTRDAYRRTVREFFRFLGGISPEQVTPRDVIRFRDHLLGIGRKSRTVSNKLSIVRSLFEYLRAGGIVALNPATTKLVMPPAISDAPAGRALTPEEVDHILRGPNRSTTEGARDYALMMVMLRLSLRLTEVSTLKVSSIKWGDKKWVLTCRVKGGREEKWPVPQDVKQAIDDYLRLDRERRDTLLCGGEDAYLFQPVRNHRTLVHDKPLSPRHVERIVGRWGDYTGIGKVTPHDLRRTVVTEMLSQGYSYRDVQMVTKHRDPKTIMTYDRARENLDSSPVNSFAYRKPKTKT